MMTVSRDGEAAGLAFAPAAAVRNPHTADETGGWRRKLPRPMVAVYVDCGELVVPPGSAFKHSCSHGPPPHSLLLPVHREGTDRELYRSLRGLAVTSVMRRTAAGGKKMRSARRQQRDVEALIARMHAERENKGMA